MSIEKLLAPKATDKQYTQAEQLRISLICRMDSYKFSHPFAYKPGIKGMTSYGTARVDPRNTIIPFGMQVLLKKYFTQQITMTDVDAAEAFSIAHFGRKLFDRKGWVKVVMDYDGFLPLIIRAVPEGTPIKGGQPIYSVTCIDEDVHWMSAAMETLIQRGVWYPTTIATQDYEIKRDIKRYYELTGADLGLLPFALHDFGGRGVSSGETAQLGGMAHLVNFMGSDTVEGVLTANFYYNEPMAGFSVYATEHAVQCSYGSSQEEQIEYLRAQLRNAPEGSIVSIVIDGYDVYREAESLCTTMRDEIIASKAKVVFRPDSGDMMEVVPRLLRMQEMAFGSVTNSKGYRKINHVGIIQGDGVDHMAIRSLLGKITAVLGYSADNVIFGSGGALLQKVNRDTLKFAQKACAILIGEVQVGATLVKDVWVGISKNPITDPGKKSKEGVLTLIRSKMTGELMTARLDLGPLNEEFEDMHQLVYHTGRLYNETTLAEVRGRVEA